MFYFFNFICSEHSFDTSSLPKTYNVSNVSDQSVFGGTISGLGRKPFEDQSYFQQLCKKLQNIIGTKGMKSAFLEMTDDLFKKSEKVSSIREQFKKKIEIRRQKIAFQELNEQKMDKIKEKYKHYSQQFRRDRKKKFEKFNQIKNQREHENKLMKKRQQKFAKQVEIDFDQIREK